MEPAFMQDTVLEDAVLEDPFMEDPFMDDFDLADPAELDVDSAPVGWVTRPSGYHSSTFILLHDEACTGEELHQILKAAIAPITGRELLSGAKLVFLNGPFRDESGGGLCWFRPSSTGSIDNSATRAQWEQLAASTARLRRKVDKEALLVGREKVFVGGLGMGFAAAAAGLLLMESRIGGLLGLGAWLPFHGDLKSLAIYGQTLAGERTLKEDGGGDGDGDGVRSSRKRSMAMMMAQGLTNRRADYIRSVATFIRDIPLDRNDDEVRLVSPDRTCVARGVDAQTPVFLVHNAKDTQVGFAYGKKALETLQRFGFGVNLNVLDEGEGHVPDREMLGALFEGFMDRGMGDEEVRGSLAEHLQGGWI